MAGCVCELLRCLNGFILHYIQLLEFEHQSETDIYGWQSWNMHTVAEEGK